MKTITIGRDLNNDVVINDSNVSRYHVQIICRGGDHFRIVDLGSTNGTFVNGRKIYGETRLFPSDTVLIGNTILPWQNYFPQCRDNSRNRHILSSALVAAGALVVCALVLFLYLDKRNNTVETIEYGVHYVPVKVNEPYLDYVYDNGIYRKYVYNNGIYRKYVYDDGIYRKYVYDNGIKKYLIDHQNYAIIVK